MTTGNPEADALVMLALGVLAAVATAWQGVKAIKEALAPLTDTIAAVRRHDRLLDEDNRRITELENSNRLVLRALSEIMEHEISGNHVDRLKQIQGEITDYLISK